MNKSGQFVVRDTYSQSGRIEARYAKHYVSSGHYILGKIVGGQSNHHREWVVSVNGQRPESSDQSSSVEYQVTGKLPKILYSSLAVK
jgi:hypothetical protein